MEKATNAFKEAECELIPLTNFSTLIKVAEEENYVNGEEAKVTLEWNKDSAGWGKKMGFDK